MTTMRKLLAGALALALLGFAPLARADNIPWQNSLPRSCTVLCSNVTVTNLNAGSVFSFEVEADGTLSGAAWFVMFFNAASLPANGTVTPVKCFAVASGTTQMGGTFAGTGVGGFPLGLVVAVSTTGCYSLTTSTHAFISVDAQ